MIEVANGAAIRVIRERTGLSLRSLADSAGISQAQLSRIETGSSPGSPTSIRKIADRLRVPRESIVTYAAEAEPAAAQA